MPKMKTRKSAAKRFSKTGGNKYKRKNAGMRHNLEGKPKKAKSGLIKTNYVHKSDVARVKKMLPYSQ
ncbi:MAG: 50S ribosomal protein L35 [Chloroflexi bacterium]|nr:50S ribosomal protein L35 [Chloroflexota bacterium]